MKINQIIGKNFKTVLSDLDFHDCWITKIVQEKEKAIIEIEYYNWEDCKNNPKAPWYTIQISIEKIVKYDYYSPDQSIFSYSIGTWEYDIHFKELKSENTCYSIKNDIEENSNYLSILLYTHSCRDIELGYNGYIKIFGFNNSIEVLKENQREELKK